MAGLMIWWICCAREANSNAISARAAKPSVRESSTTARIFSPIGVPPGSRVTMTSRPLARSDWASFSSCVVLPQPSRPSKVMNRPRGELTDSSYPKGGQANFGAVSATHILYGPVASQNVCGDWHDWLRAGATADNAEVYRARAPRLRHDQTELR